MTPEPPREIFVIINSVGDIVAGEPSRAGVEMALIGMEGNTIVRYVPEKPDNDLDLPDKAAIEARLAELVKIQRAVKLRIDLLAVRHALFDRPMPAPPMEGK
jgi:hypothetical protein